MALLSSCEEKEVRRFNIEGTNLTVVNEVVTYRNQYTGTEREDYWSLVDDKGDTICPKFMLNWGNPFKNARGVVLIPNMGVCDCRDGKIEVIQLPLMQGWQTTTVEPSEKSKDIVLIFRKQGGLDGTSGKHYHEYNLCTKALSALKEYVEE
ncbi:MAG: hypothetical protein J6Y53_03890 [Alphaproteobacteria bacterium]|nr:hypothetical protein [Alphaproteobacteria bacterium]